MSDKKTAIKQGIQELLDELPNLKKLSGSTKDILAFGAAYQRWYTKALRVIEQLAPDRYDEFIAYYQIEPKRKLYDAQTYVIQDYVGGIGASTDAFDKPRWNIHTAVFLKLVNQHQILGSLFSRIDEVISNIEMTLYSDLQDAELDTASKLKSRSLRASGALAGVVLESHLQKVAASHKVKVTKRESTISELNDILKNANVYEVATWRKIQYMADIRNLCSHKKDADPTESQIDELINGVNSIVKTVL